MWAAVYDSTVQKRAKKGKWNMLIGSGTHSDDILGPQKYISCRWPYKARKICYTKSLNLKNCPGAPPDP